MIRRAMISDIPALVQMALRFHAHADLGVPVDPDYLSGSFRNMIASPSHLVLVLADGCEAVGVFCAVASRSPWAPVAVAAELGLWIEPEHRGGGAVLRLLRAYVAWAQEMGCVRATMTALPGRSLDALYARSGFAPDEINYTRCI